MLHALNTHIKKKLETFPLKIYSIVLYKLYTHLIVIGNYLYNIDKAYSLIDDFNHS